MRLRRLGMARAPFLLLVWQRYGLLRVLGKAVWCADDQARRAATTGAYVVNEMNVKYILLHILLCCILCMLGCLTTTVSRKKSGPQFIPHHHKKKSPSGKLRHSGKAKSVIVAISVECGAGILFGFGAGTIVVGKVEFGWGEIFAVQTFFRAPWRLSMG
ncbi:hypothetical protein GGTG_13096 [Gaeumannomyces tritici R3-111a-1]|uniref:Uncharacterized protein n=1 Tax=Gaeumannomyces tritici (strain R3-111a-1) TaxID=644352 RepID=J3PHW5_GAET3|nr:hypothetical protein GGTG_13096 [Gaeumannomyces tritici R3-111a-1]EJT69477.1 hypothetical protein GGTG_13096 [Gaeumannomyces tritici R3-111a-1]